MTPTRIETPNETLRGEPSDRAEISSADVGASTGIRRPYHKPQLRVLGSVRDLTFGSPVVGVNDFMGGNVMTM